jgi:hypothetical protein
MSETTVEDIVTDCEKRFAFPELLDINYFQKYRRSYYSSRELGLLSCHRNYVNLLTFLEEINEYNQQHANSYVKRFRENANDWRNCEAIFSEVIVYRHYIRPIYEGLIKALELHDTEADVIVERLDGTKAYLEVFCVMPCFRKPDDGEFVVYEVKTHTQTAKASIRQKLLNKILTQQQLSKPRENYAVIELNDPSIAGDFSVLSSLSSGYTITFNKETREVISEGYNWDGSVFEDSSTQYVKAIIHFSLGNYDSRKFLFNPNFHSPVTPNMSVERDASRMKPRSRPSP